LRGGISRQTAPYRRHFTIHLEREEFVRGCFITWTDEAPKKSDVNKSEVQNLLNFGLEVAHAREKALPCALLSEIII